MSSPSLSSSLLSSTFRFEIESITPRLGNLTVYRKSLKKLIQVQTPGLITCTSRGVIPHLSSDHHLNPPIKWIHVPFESFLEHSPPFPTLHPGPYPLHSSLGFRPEQHILSMSLRDPADDRDMPPNGNQFVSALCLRGVRKASPDQWRDYVSSVQPDLVLALSDIPFSSASLSQKRLTKSIERSASWLANILRPLPAPATGPDANLNILVHMAGGIIPAARQAFSQSLLDPLFDKEAEAIKPLTNLDEGVVGYSFDLAPLHKSLSPNLTLPTTSKSGFIPFLDLFSTPPAPSSTAQIISLIRTSLTPLPTTKPRIVHSAGSPHEVLALIRDVGIDLFDAHWAQRAADVGVALDFVFPAPVGLPDPELPRQVGHNLYDKRYSHDFSSFADFHPPPAYTPVPYTRAYVHHLLCTHEMSAHTLLALHNLAVLDMFFVSVRRVLLEEPESFSQHVAHFEQTYDEKLGVLAEARKLWTEVSLARGKGRLAREREKQNQDAQNINGYEYKK
ncbi:tRNA-guanine(15) transglycosylase-like protein [Multifurca ochricompacta]|uniref:tRNA-guanine(15) transglycosylase-like protein n=1 Tax=Multifurca ochricompacta TaxID=376703 RepID=A0AAD4M2W9_9AGAM|nr:tRNA-guanine(15) transglycosylase-like protein [Multifurca ochricompacta]